MKNTIILLALMFAASIGAHAQPAQCQVTGTLYRSAGASGAAACTSCTLTITKTVIGGTVTSTTPVTFTSSATTGVVTFSVPRGSLVTIRGSFVTANCAGLKSGDGLCLCGFD